MAKYTGKAVTVPGTPESMAEKFADMSVFGAGLDKLPADQRAKIGNVRFTTDSMVLENPQVGDISFAVKERTPQRVVFAGNGPLPMVLSLNFRANGEDKTDIEPEMDVEIPMFLRPMLGPLMSKSLDQMAELMGRIAAE